MRAHVEHIVYHLPISQRAVMRCVMAKFVVPGTRCVDAWNESHSNSKLSVLIFQFSAGKLGRRDVFVPSECAGTWQICLHFSSTEKFVVIFMEGIHCLHRLTICRARWANYIFFIESAATSCWETCFENAKFHFHPSISKWNYYFAARDPVSHMLCCSIIKMNRATYRHFDNSTLAESNAIQSNHKSTILPHSLPSNTNADKKLVQLHEHHINVWLFCSRPMSSPPTAHLSCPQGHKVFDRRIRVSCMHCFVHTKNW